MTKKRRILLELFAVCLLLSLSVCFFTMKKVVAFADEAEPFMFDKKVYCNATINDEFVDNKGLTNSGGINVMYNNI